MCISALQSRLIPRDPDVGSFAVLSAGLHWTDARFNPDPGYIGDGGAPSADASELLSNVAARCDLITGVHVPAGATVIYDVKL